MMRGYCLRRNHIPTKQAMKRILWKIVSSERFVHVVHDVGMASGILFLIAYFYWLFVKQ